MAEPRRKRTVSSTACMSSIDKINAPDNRLITANHRLTISNNGLIEANDLLAEANEGLFKANQCLFDANDSLTHENAIMKEIIEERSQAIHKLDKKIQNLRKLRQADKIESKAELEQVSSNNSKQHNEAIQKLLMELEQHKTRINEVEMELAAFKDIEPGATATKFKRMLQHSRAKAQQANQNNIDLIDRIIMLESKTFESEHDTQNNLEAHHCEKGEMTNEIKDLRQEIEKLKWVCSDLEMRIKQQHTTSQNKDKILGDTYTLIIALENLLELISNMLPIHFTLLVKGLKHVKDAKLVDILQGTNDVTKDEVRYRLLMQTILAATRRI